MKKQILIGSDDFKKLIERNFYFADKSFLIEELCQHKSEVCLFTRPRRFGKSLAISMLKNFFKIGSDKSLFNGLKISDNRKLCQKYQGNFPVISMTLKGISDNTYGKAFRDFAFLIGHLVDEFDYLLHSPRLEEKEKNTLKLLMSLSYQRIDDAETENTIVKESLKTLCGMLYKHHQIKPIVLIDEYDVPLAQAFYNGYYDEMISLIRGFFNNGLKSNPNLEFAVLTGCLKISKESIFTGMNNLKVFTVADNNCSTAFGFTDDEVKGLLDDYNLSERYADVKKWYDGFRIGKNSMFSPWDVLQFVQDASPDKDLKPKYYWTASSSNDIIKVLLQKAGRTAKEEIEQLISGRTVTKAIKHEITYNELYSTVDNVWSVMLSTGYLTILGEDDDGRSILAIPNYEIRKLYIEKIEEWFKETTSKDEKTLTEFQSAFFEGDAEKIERLFNNYMMATIGLRDEARHDEYKESFYHGVLLGLLSTPNFQGVVVKSNQEAGLGYCDIYMKSCDDSIGVIIEVKYPSDKTMEASCDEALAQIETRQYDKIFDSQITKAIHKYAIACHKKHCKVKGKKAQHE